MVIKINHFRLQPHIPLFASYPACVLGAGVDLVNQILEKNIPMNNKLITKADGGHPRLYYLGHWLSKAVTSSYAFNKQYVPREKKR